MPLLRRLLLHPELVFVLVVAVAANLSVRSSDSGARWVSLSDIPWARATTGWRAVTNRQEPVVDAAFFGQPIRIGNTERARGMSAYPPAEIVYRLDGQALRFAAEVGVDDRSAPEPRVRFRAFLDGAAVFESEPLGRGASRPVELTVQGARELRLVAERADGRSGRVYPTWLDARLLVSTGADSTLTAANPLVAQAQADVVRRAEARARERSDLRARARASVERFRSRPESRSADAGEVATTFDAGERLVVLGNDRVLVTLGFGGARHGRLSIVDLETGEFLLTETTAGVRFEGQTYRLAAESLPARPDAFRFADLVDPVLGRGRELAADFVVPRVGATVTLRLALFAGRSYLMAQIETRGGSPTRFAPLVAEEAGGFLLGNGGEYLADYSRLVRWPVGDDGIRREEPIGQGKPAFVWNQAERRGLLIAALDESRKLGEFSLAIPPGSGIARLGFSAGASTADPARSPRFLIAGSTGAAPIDAFADYRRIVQALYLPRPMPDWIKHQWVSWYAYYMDQDEERIKDQIDYIANNLRDLGPWNVIVDAGWYVAAGRDGADFRTVDRAKFPSGLRALVDYAHERGVQITHYLTLPYLDDWRHDGHWFGLREIVEAHPDWLIPLVLDEERRSYVFDLTNPAARAYLREVLADFFVRYGGDGIKIDGLGNAESALRDRSLGDRFGLADPITLATMEIFRLIASTIDELKPGAYIQSGWDGPIPAMPLNHSFLYADEYPAFSNPYPMPGLVEHIEAASIRRLLYGQRANMGTIYDDPARSIVNRWWLEAALALGEQVAVSFDLTTLTPQLLDVYRQRLVPSNAFRGETRTAPTLSPDVFATTTDGTLYLGFLNRAPEPRPMAASLAEFGLPGNGLATAYEVESGQFRRVRNTVRTVLPSEHFRLFVIRRDPGVLWTNSSYTIAAADRGLELTVRGPWVIEGFVDLLAGGEPEHVLLDGVPLESGLREGPHYSYDPATRVVHVVYDHARPHVVRVTW